MDQKKLERWLVSHAFTKLACNALRRIEQALSLLSLKNGTWWAFLKLAKHKLFCCGTIYSSDCDLDSLAKSESTQNIRFASEFS